jgi:hypothetical protein
LVYKIALLIFIGSAVLAMFRCGGIRNNPT